MWAGPCSFDQDYECFVTDITQELSASLESSALFENSLFEYDDVQPTGCSDFDSVTEQFCDEFKTELSSGSGSETSSLELGWSGKTELDTPPTTPPLALNAENIRIISETVTLFPYSLKGGNSQSKPKIKSIAAKELKSNCKHGEKVQNASLSKEELQKQQVERRKERMIRNRESAYLSRKRAKEHVSLLENQVKALTIDNQRLKKENFELCKRLRKYEPDSQTSWYRFPDLPKKTTVLLVIAFTFCVNFHTISLFDGGLNKAGMSMANDPVSHHTRSLLWIPSLDENSLSNLSCPVAINQSESMRLERELREWIVGGGESSPPSFTPQPQVNSSRRRKRIPRLRRARSFPLDMWSLKPSMLGLEGLYEAIHRRDDTFYLVSFSADHLLLPAMASNATTRPKMSFMLPAFLTNSSTGGQVEMMQIDCEVTNTQLLSVRDDNIPSRLRAARKFSNDSVKTVEKEFSSYSLPDNNHLYLHHLKNTTTSDEESVMKKKSNSSDVKQEDILPLKPHMFWLKLNSTHETTSEDWDASFKP